MTGLTTPGHRTARLLALLVRRPLALASGLQPSGEFLNVLFYFVVALRLPAVPEPEFAVLVGDGKPVEKPPQDSRQSRGFVHPFALNDAIYT